MNSFNETIQNSMNIVVRLCGLVLLFIGLWIAIQIFNEALVLYKNPAKIERIATAIEIGSNIDKSIAPIREGILDKEEKTDPNKKNGIRVSYFIAWVIDLLLLLLLARIAIMAVKTGGELALFDIQIKKFAKQTIERNRV